MTDPCKIMHWLCGECGNNFDFEDDAKECCQEVVYCSYCDVKFDSKDLVGSSINLRENIEYIFCSEYCENKFLIAEAKGNLSEMKGVKYDESR